MTMRPRSSILLGCVALLSPPAFAQVGQTNPESDVPPAIVDTQATTTAKTNGSRIGQRQSREEAALSSGIKPMARIDNRIANRVQSRLRNRIDGNYDQQANAASPFKVAQDQVRRGTPSR